MTQNRAITDDSGYHYPDQVTRLMHAVCNAGGLCDDIYQTKGNDTAYVMYEPATVLADIIEIGKVIATADSTMDVHIFDLWTLKEAHGIVVIEGIDGKVILEVYDTANKMERRVDEICEHGESIMSDGGKATTPSILDADITSEAGKFRSVRHVMEAYERDTTPPVKASDALQAAMKNGKLSFTLDELRKMSPNDVREMRDRYTNPQGTGIDELQRLVSKPAEPMPRFKSAADELERAMKKGK